MYVGTSGNVSKQISDINPLIFSHLNVCTDVIQLHIDIVQCYVIVAAAVAPAILIKFKFCWQTQDLERWSLGW